MPTLNTTEPKPWAITAGRRLASAFFLLAACGAHQALADAADTHELAPGDIETVFVTATRLEKPQGEHAGNAFSIDQEQLQLTGHTHIQQALVQVPGVNLARGNGQEYLPALRSAVLTGAGACGSVLSAVDGIALRAQGFCNINELFDAPTESAQSIEVIRGPATAFYGSNAMHGLINVLTPGVGERPSSYLGVEAGADDFYRLKVGGSYLSGQHGFRADIVAAHDGGYSDDSGYDQQKATLRHEYHSDNLSVASSLLMSNLNQETAGYIVGTDAYKDPALNKTNPNPQAYRDSSYLRLSSRIELALDERQTIAITPYLRYSDMDFLQHFLPGTPLEENGQTSIGLQSAYYADISDSFEWALGLDGEFTQAWLKQTQDQPTQGSAFLEATIPVGKHYDYEVDALMLATFVHGRWALGERLALTAGLRLETMRYDYDNRMLDGRTDDQGQACGFGGCRYSRPSDRHDTFTNASPKLSALYRVNEQQRVYASLTQGFRAPQATELYRLQRDQNLAELDSENLISAELGWLYTTDRTDIEVALYQMKKRNVIFRDSDYFNQADGTTTHQGIELAVDHGLTSTLSLAVAASYAEHRYDDERQLNGISLDNKLIDSAPRFFANARVKWTPVSSLRAELEWVKQGRYYTDPENLHDYSGHQLFNLRGHWQTRPQLGFSAQISNLTNEVYAERADYSSFAGDRYFAGRERALTLAFNLNW